VSKSIPPSRLIILTIWLLILAASSWIVLSKLQLITNVAQFMPEAKTPAEKLLVDELHQGAAARMMLIAITGGDLKRITQASKRLATQLRGHPAFARVDNGEQSLPSLEDTPLFRYRYLLSPNISAEYFSSQALNAAFQQRLLDLTSPFALINKQLLPKDPTNETGALAQRLLAQHNTRSQFGVWVSADHQRALLVAETRAPGYELDAQMEAIAAIRSAFDPIQQDNADLQLILSGPAVFATNSRAHIQQEVTSLSILASVAVMLILWLAYRSAALVLLNAIPLLSALLVASALLTLTYGPIHGITLAFGITVIGVAIDYPIHLFSHLSGRNNVGEEFKIIWPTMRLGVITTVAGYSAMTTAHFSGLAQLGWFAIIGLITAALVTRWVLPCLLPRHYAPIAEVRILGRFTVLLQPGRKAVVASLLIGLTALGFILLKTDALWENDLSALSPIPKQQLSLDRQLRADMGAPDASHLIVLSAASAEDALQQSESLYSWLHHLIQQGAISDFDAASRYLPSQQRQLERQALLPEKSQLDVALDQALQGLPFKKAQFDPFVQAVANAKTMQPITLPVLQDSALGLKIESLLFERGAGWTALILLYGVNNSELISASVPQQSNVVYLNFKTATNQLIQGFRSETLTRMQWAAVFILLVLGFSIRKPSRVMAALLPVALAIVVTVALLLAIGQSLSLFNLVALLLVFGIGIDYGLFFSRHETDPPMRHRTFHALSVCALSTVSVFAILSLSAVPVLQDIGITVWVGVLFSFIFALLLSQQNVAEQSKTQPSTSQ
jgi:predicted exporter